MTVVALALILGSSWTLGDLLARALRFQKDDRLTAFALTLAAGLGSTALLLGLLSLVGGFAWSPILLALLSIPAALAIFRFRNLPPLRFPIARACGLAAAMVSFALLADLAPVTDSDSLAYPLRIAQHLAVDGRWRFWPDVWLGVFPLSQELLVAFVMNLGGDRFAALAGLELALCAALLYSLARRLEMSPDVAAVAVLVGLACPAAAFLAQSAKEDLLVCVMTLGAAHALVPRGENPAAVGLFAGFAAGAKYSGIPVAIGVLLALLAFSKNRLRRAAIAAGVALAAGGLWYAVSFVRYGNPLPPYLSPPLPTFLSPLAQMETSRAFRWGAGRGILDFIVAPIRMFVTPARFGGLGSAINPLAWLGVAGLGLPSLRKRLAPFGLIAAVLYASWFFTDQIARLLLPMALLLSLPAAELLADLSIRSRAARLSVVLALSAAAASVILVSGLHVTRYLASPASFLSRETWNHEDLEWMNGHLDPTRDRVATTFKASWYLRIPWLDLDPVYQAEITPEELATKESAIAALRRQRITHLYGPKGFLPGGLEAVLPLIHENPSSRLGGVHLFREAPRISTAVYGVPSAPSAR